ncbi:RNA polymerase alpha subunit C-terminal domain-containing protein [Rossellomorea sp. LjRoot5]|uniref:RNA polymerase alpha subunit C-terminal domain-containing protein n=1 Tax=Rossellomorea sp. LjRoot5 TaxID=3342331 RepID=UPI003ECEDFAC
MTSKEKVKICDNGHTYVKKRDCPTCPVCEKERKPDTGFLSILSSPARRALENNGITTLEELAGLSEKEILAFHGMGPSSIPKLRKVLGEKGLGFRGEG